MNIHDMQIGKTLANLNTASTIILIFFSRFMLVCLISLFISDKQPTARAYEHAWFLKVP